VDARLFGRPMAFWKTMTQGMVLRSNLRASHLIDAAGPLSVEAFANATGLRLRQPVLLENFVEYGMWATQMTVADVDECDVRSLSGTGGAFVLGLDDGRRLSARRVVLACGIKAFETMPAGLERLPRELVSHTGTYSDMSMFAGQRVALVGG